MPFRLTSEQMRRYSRHILLPEVGGKGQRRLLDSRVLIIGAGGLGSPVALYLASAGVGTLGIVDSDRVDLTNLQRQILHKTRDIGRLKVESAQETLQELNPDLQIHTYPVRLTSENVLEIFQPYDMIVDGSDNFPTRYLVNDACVLLNKPLSHGAIFRFEGQVLTIVPRKGPCYRCVFPTPPPPDLVPSCQETGVFGALAGVIGSIQATEVIHYLLGRQPALQGNLLVYDSLEQEFRKILLGRNPQCPVCGDQPSITKLLDYEEHCGIAL